MKNLRSRLFAAVLGASALAFAPAAQAQTLSGRMTVDNYFTAYLSTSATSLGTALISGSNWPSTYSFSTQLNQGQNYFLHIAAGDYGVISGVLGSFSLAGSGFQFANGQQTLNTNTTNWTASLGATLPSAGGPQVNPPVSFASPVGALPTGIRSQGTNGVNPWGNQFPTISSQAQWIWTTDNCINCGRYFTTVITSTVPEPSTWALMATGLVAIVVVGRRRRSV